MKQIYIRGDMIVMFHEENYYLVFYEYSLQVTSAKIYV